MFPPVWSDLSLCSACSAHIGHNVDKNPAHQINAIAMSKHRNIWADTSSSASLFGGIIEYAVQQVGSDRILFGTDTPLYNSCAPLSPAPLSAAPNLPRVLHPHTSIGSRGRRQMHRGRIDMANISDEDKERILASNAVELFTRSRFLESAGGWPLPRSGYFED